MRAATFVTCTALLLLPLTGCAALSGLDGISEQACAPDCDGGAGADGTVPPGDDGSTGVDGTIPDDSGASPDSTLSAGDSGMTALDSSSSDSGNGGGDSGAHDAASDSMAPADTGAADTGAADTGTDSGGDGGCGATNTIANCSACGVKCTPNDASAPVCSGTTCSYTCNTGFLDCNASTAPDPDGCECYAPGATVSQCCSGFCPQQHDYENGSVGTTFYDCVSVGTINKAVALDACTAYTGNASQCDNAVANFYCTYPDGGTVGDMVCSNGSTAKNCACWGYDGALLGLMEVGGGTGNTNCPCPVPGDPTWN